MFCNVYCTPPGAQTVPCHTDDRDVFVLQVHGAKQWTVYAEPPVVLPYKEEEVGKKVRGGESAAPASGATSKTKGNINDEQSPPDTPAYMKSKCFEGVIECGDVLYLPRGFAHEAKALAGSPSVHLTIAVQTSDWDASALIADGVRAALAAVARDAGRMGPAAAPAEYALRAVLPPTLLRAAAAGPSPNGLGSDDDDGDDKNDVDCEADGADAGNDDVSSRKTRGAHERSRARREAALAAQSASLQRAFTAESAYVAQLKDSVALVLGRLQAQPELCIATFRARMLERKSERDALFSERVSGLRCFPLNMTSLIQWNARVSIVSVVESNGNNSSAKRAATVGNISHVVVLQKRMRGGGAPPASSDGSKPAAAAGDDVDRMQLQVSAAVVAVLRAWSEHFVQCPAAIAEMCAVVARAEAAAGGAGAGAVAGGTTAQQHAQVDRSLVCLSIAGFLLRNGCFVRVS